MARARQRVAAESAVERHEAIIAEYRRALAEPARLPEGPWPPVRIGPTWQIGEDGCWLLPRQTLGWDVLGWCGTWLQHARGVPWRFTLEQARFVLHWYAIDGRGRFLYHDGVLQRMKGWGKDPLGACLMAVELLGPARFDGWDEDGRPIAADVADAWVQTAAVSLDQTKNTMRLFPGLFTAEAKRRFRLQVGKEQAYALQDSRFLQAVTRSPTTLEGARATFVLLNEALALDTPLPTPDGWTTMEKVEPGTVLIGSDGNPTTVIAATETQEGRACYRLTFEDGSSLVASDGHLWQTKVASSAALPRVRSTAEMVADGRRFRVPVPKPWELPEQCLPVDPYALGLWLGDGSTGQPYLTASGEDAPFYVEELGRRGIEARIRPHKGRATRIALSRATGFHRGTAFGEALRALPCFRCKHIPAPYLRASIRQRVDLLRGLMDSDGCATKDGYCVFVGREQLALDVVELLHSLGQTPRLSFAADSRSRHGGSYRVGFTARHGMDPFLLPRKRGRAKARSGRDPDWLSIARIESVGSVPVRCIAVDAPDSLFLAGVGAVVTHNTHLWEDANEGHEMAAVIERNAAKSPDGGARTLRITNAYEPGMDSVAERDREAWEKVQAGQAVDVGLLYDSLEAHPEAPLTEEVAREMVPLIRGDSVWLDPERVVKEILDVRNPPSQSRRFWWNQIVAAEDAWLSRQEWDARARRKETVVPGEIVTLGFDGSKSDDWSALVGCRASDGHLFTLGLWDPERHGGEAPREAIDGAVRQAFAVYDVVGFYSDVHPFESYVDAWSAELGAGLCVKASGRSAVGWDMRGRTKEATFAAEAFHDAVVEGGLISHEGAPGPSQQVYNARRRPNQYGIAFGKESRESARKVDWASAAVLAYLARKDYLGLPASRRRRKRTGGAHFV